MKVSQTAAATMEDRLDRRKHIVQAVYDLWEIQPCETLFFDENEERHCKIIIIGSESDRTHCCTIIIIHIEMNYTSKH